MDELKKWDMLILTLTDFRDEMSELLEEMEESLDTCPACGRKYEND